MFLSSNSYTQPFFLPGLYCILFTLFLFFHLLLENLKTFKRKYFVWCVDDEVIQFNTTVKDDGNKTANDTAETEKLDDTIELADNSTAENTSAASLDTSDQQNVSNIFITKTSLVLSQFALQVVRNFKFFSGYIYTYMYVYTGLLYIRIVRNVRSVHCPN